MNLSTLTGKKVRVMIKRGETLKDLMAKYECTEDELRSRIDHLFTIKGAAHDVWNQLVANGKKVKSFKPPVLNQEPEQNQTEEAIVSVPDNTEVLGIQQLRESEEEKSKTVLSLEKEYSAIERERYELRKRFQALRKEIADLKRTYLKRCQSAEKIIQKDNDLNKRMGEVAAACQEEKAALEAIREKIEEVSKIVLSVYENGEIALFEGILTDNKLDDRGYEDLYNSLREREEAEDFRPRDLRVIARLIKIVSRISVPFDIIFENEEVESGYKVFK